MQVEPLCALRNPSVHRETPLHFCLPLQPSTLPQNPSACYKTPLHRCLPLLPSAAPRNPSMPPPSTLSRNSSAQPRNPSALPPADRRHLWIASAVADLSAVAKPLYATACLCRRPLPHVSSLSFIINFTCKFSIK